MCCAICIGILVAVAAGIAYGYNYMLAEFLTLSRTDLSVYVRRGQFYDKPNFGKGFRRKGDEDDLFSSNSSDYQDTKIDSDSKPLSDTWRKALDTRKYAEKLTKYSQGRGTERFFNSSKDEKEFDVPESTPQDNKLSVIRRVYSVTPNPVMPTTIHPARTDIVMRNFKPIDKMPISSDTNALEADFYQDSEHTTPEMIKKSKYKEKKPDIKISLKEQSKSSKYVPMRNWSSTKSSHADYPSEEVDEDNIVYKPV